MHLWIIIERQQSFTGYIIFRKHLDICKFIKDVCGIINRFAAVYIYLNHNEPCLSAYKLCVQIVWLQCFINIADTSGVDHNEWSVLTEAIHKTAVRL